MQANQLNTALVPQFRRACSYIEQEDHLIPTLTVDETVTFFAQLQIVGSPAVIQSAVTSVLRRLALSHVRGTKVGGVLPGGLTLRGISGGERRRVSIACGIVAKPSLIFLDEPTSGLDAQSALALAHVLRRLTAPPSLCTIVCAIHQPRSSIFQMFDRVCILQQGYSVYFGRPAGVVPYFEQLLGQPKPSLTSAADFALDAMTQPEFRNTPALRQTCLDRVDAAMAEALPAIEAGLSPGSELEERCRSTLRPEAWTRLQALVRRSRMYFLRNLGNAVARLIVSAFLGLLVGLAYVNADLSSSAAGVENRLRLLFYLSILTVLLPFQTISLFQDTRLYYIRERSAQLYATLEFFVSVLLWELVLVFACTVLLAVLSLGISRLPHTAGNFFYDFLLLLLMYLCSSTLMTCVSNITPNADLAFAIGAFLMSVFFICAGFFITLDQLPDFLAWIPYLTCVAALHSLVKIHGETLTDCLSPPPPLPPPSAGSSTATKAWS